MTTDGKWQVNRLSSPPTIYKIDDIGCPHLIATMSGDLPYEEAYENAQMMAVAPRLYHVLSGLLKALGAAEYVKHDQATSLQVIAGLHVLAEARKPHEQNR